MSAFSSQASFDGDTFRKLDLPDIIGKEFFDCTFDHCTLIEGKLKGCRFVDCEFVHCDLSLSSVVDSTFNKTTFTDCKLMGINWTAAHWTKGFSSVGFTRCNLNYGVFIGLDLKKLVMVECVANGADFSEATLAGANFSGTNFEEARFNQTNLEGANFVGATHYAIDVQANSLKKAKFSLPEALSLLGGLGIELVDDTRDRF